MPISRDDDVVMQRDPKGIGRGLDLAGHSDVFA
jgi:hypothetical protein